MSESSTACCEPKPLDGAIAAFRRQAFAALLSGGEPTIAEIAELASRDANDVAHAVMWLESHGQLERSGELLIGAHGLTRRITPHTLTIDGRMLHTWCAYDAVAIPVALGVTAQAATTCPSCGRDLTVEIDAGQPHGTPALVLWQPTGPCEHVIEDFCVDANMFCSAAHLDVWRRGAGQPSGRPLELTDITELARHDWADITPA